MGRPFRPFYSGRQKIFLVPPAAFKIEVRGRRASARAGRGAFGNLPAVTQLDSFTQFLAIFAPARVL